jgi:hypothetical protein
MFNHETLKVGDVFYGIQERNAAFHRKKIHQVIDGQDWFRYDKPLNTYELVTFKVLGILRKELEGKWKYDEDTDLETEYFLESTNATHVQRYTDFLDDDAGDDYFVDKQKALDYIKILETQTKELDKT